MAVLRGTGEISERNVTVCRVCYCCYTVVYIGPGKERKEKRRRTYVRENKREVGPMQSPPPFVDEANESTGAARN